MSHGYPEYACSKDGTDTNSEPEKKQVTAAVVRKNEKDTYHDNTVAECLNKKLKAPHFEFLSPLLFELEDTIK